MERIVKKDSFGDIACNDIIIYSINRILIEKNIANSNTDWKVIKPKYYRYLDDNTILEIWYNGIGVLLSGKIEGYISKSWSEENREEITYEQAMEILKTKQEKGYNNKGLMDKKMTQTEIDFDKEEHKTINCRSQEARQNNNGGASDWYSLPENANTLQDLIEHRNMNGSVKDIFKACYRLGIKTEDELRDLNKMAYYSLREIGRITGRKDYITIAKELIGSQSEEEDEYDF